MRTLRMEEMNWVDIKKAIKDGFKTVVIGVGSTRIQEDHIFTRRHIKNPFSDRISYTTYLYQSLKEFSFLARS